MDQPERWNSSNYPLDPEADARSQLAPLGVAEIGALLGIADRSVHQAIRRRTLPDAQFASVNGGRAWSRETIVRWAGESGRIRPEAGELADEYRRRFGLDPRPYIDRRHKSR
jgi:hypothetical protein